jgi:uncharacterized membrane protein YhaH (DUF805 family)
LWSEYSTKSQWVREEARMGRDKSKLIPALLDSSAQPFGFGEVQAANLSTWRGEPNHPEWTRLAAAVRNAVGPTAPASEQSREREQSREPIREQAGQHMQAAPTAQAQPQAFSATPTPPSAAGEQLSPIGYVQKCLRMYVNGAGRARRAEYGWWMVFLFVASIVGYGVDIGVSGVNEYSQPNAQIVSSVVGLALFAPGVSVLSRRFHDLGLSGWLVAGIFAAYLIAYLLVAYGAGAVGGLISLVAAAVAIGIVFVPGKPGANQYGPNPKGL